MQTLKLVHYTKRRKKKPFIVRLDNKKLFFNYDTIINRSKYLLITQNTL